MTKQSAGSLPPPMQALEDDLSAPSLVRSSEGSGWEGLEVRVYQEPGEIETWRAPVQADVSLGLIVRGAMHLEQRQSNGSWKALPLRQGDLFLRPGGSEPYELRWKSLSIEPIQTLQIHVSADLVAHTAEEMAMPASASTTLVEQVGFQDPLLRHIGLALWQELEQPASSGPLYAQAAAHLLAAHLLRQYGVGRGAVQAPPQQLTRQQLHRVTEFILAHLSQDLSLDLLAGQSGYSRYHFARLFHQTVGESPYQFVLRQRIEHAKRLLRETGFPLMQVALESGFANQSHLTQCFKRRLGLTPRAYRRECEI